MAQKKETEAKDTAAPVSPVNEQVPAKSKSSTGAKKATPATPADAPAKPAVTTAKASKTTAKPAATTPAPADAAAKPVATKKTAAPKKPAASRSASLTKVYGEIQASDNKYFIQKGSVPEGQLQLIPQKDKQDLNSRIPSYSGQFVTVLGEFAGKKTDKSPTFTIHNIASHDEIARKAYELSHENPADVQDNWFRAENEILQPK